MTDQEILQCLAMLPYFRAAECHNYARYCTFYIHEMKSLDPQILRKMQTDAFVRQNPGIYNSTWTDMFIETMYMRLGQGPAGTAGLATENNQMVKWALSFTLSAELSQQTLAKSGHEIHSVQLHHKEEAEGKA